MREFAKARMIFIFPLLGNSLHLFKRVLVNDGFMGVADNFPLGLRCKCLTLTLIEGLFFSTLYHVTAIRRM